MPINNQAKALIAGSIKFNAWLKENGPIEDNWYASKTEEGLFSPFPVIYDGELYRWGVPGSSGDSILNDR
jgi:hypothetical protein